MKILTKFILLCKLSLVQYKKYFVKLVELIMVRNRKRKALYEVMSKSRYKPSIGKTLEKLHPQEKDEAHSATAKTEEAIPKSTAQWWKRPKIIQINAGRVELSMPYQLAIAILLGLIALFLIVFRFGQFYQRVADSSAKIQKSSQLSPVERDTAKIMNASVSAENKLPGSEKVEPAKSTGNNRIVIQTFQVMSQLEPAKSFFAQYGIETEIRKIGDMYYLVTSNKFENPANPGTDGYRARQVIIELGAKYQAPSGYETFGPRPFHDAYGMKFDD